MVAVMEAVSASHELKGTVERMTFSQTRAVANLSGLLLGMPALKLGMSTQQV